MFFIIDYLLLCIAVALATLTSPSVIAVPGQSVFDQPAIIIQIIVLPLFCALSLRLSNLPFAHRRKTIVEFPVQIALGVFLGILAFQLSRALLTARLPDRTIHLLLLGYGFVIILTHRVVLHLLAHRYSLRILVIGSRGLYDSLNSHKERLRDERYTFFYLNHDTFYTATDCLLNTAISGHISKIESALKLNNCSAVLVDSSSEILREFDSFWIKLLSKKVDVFDSSIFFEKYVGAVDLSSLHHRWFLGFLAHYNHPFYLIFKRCIDIFISIAGLLLLSPLFILVSVLSLILNGSPVFYTQTRTGQFGVPFTIYKFRTMFSDSEREGAKWASINDSRITRFGLLLRKSRIDELPQFLNILLGDMTFVGPRPERPEFVKLLSENIPFYDSRHIVKPGLTGWAQINYSYGSNVEDAKAKLSYDLYYLKYTSLYFDLIIMFRTLAAMARGSR